MARARARKYTEQQRFSLDMRRALLLAQLRTQVSAPAALAANPPLPPPALLPTLQRSTATPAAPLE